MIQISHQVRDIIVFTFITQEKYVMVALIIYISKQKS